MARGKEPVAFLGIGTMGHAMATRALGAGIPSNRLEPQPGCDERSGGSRGRGGRIGR